ncbi:hypothetical protein HK105_204458 [Polyrhizophydium stewartii]|uniref:Cyclic nucleotide-binding domain-containing protein n=1 Tax=Polyrhizophydium stewartii TaxID=2732419 RepID=A0ABR4N998_9FUNG
MWNILSHLKHPMLTCDNRKIHEYIVLRDNPMSAGREEALDMIIKLMSLRIRSFTRFNHLQKRRICEIMRFESYPESALILKEGHPVTFMYFLVNGQVELFQIREGTKYRVGLVNPGDTFGEVHMLPALRTESIATTMPTEVLIVYQNDFFEILKMQDPNHRAFKENLLAPVFDQFLISRAIESFQIITFEPSETILFEGVGSIFMFWVLNGACDARKTITFVRKRGRSGNDYVKGPLMPYDGERVLAADEETMQQVLTVRTLEQGNHVPNMPAYGEDLDLIVESTFNKNRYVENVRQLTVSSPELASFYTVVARSKATLAKISLYEFAFHASPGLLLSLLRTAPALPSVRELQEAFIEKVNWEQYRRKVVGEVHSQRPHS